MRPELLLAIITAAACIERNAAYTALIGGTRGMRSGTALHATPARRQPRRNLKKRKGRERRGPVLSPAVEESATKAFDVFDEEDVRPLVSSRSKELGADYWIDPEDLKKEQRRLAAIVNRKALDGEMPKEKLRKEVVAPYKQNWIGFLFVLITVIAVIIDNFPEVLNYPAIHFPDLDSGGEPIPLQSQLIPSDSTPIDAL